MIEPHERMSVEHMLVAGYTLDAIERHIRKWAIIKVLNAEQGHQIKTAARLGMHRNTLTRMIKDLGIKTHINGRKSPRRLYSEPIPHFHQIVNERDPQI